MQLRAYEPAVAWLKDHIYRTFGKIITEVRYNEALERWQCYANGEGLVTIVSKDEMDRILAVLDALKFIQSVATIATEEVEAQQRDDVEPPYQAY